jgi:hypothetical protein
MANDGKEMLLKRMAIVFVGRLRMQGSENVALPHAIAVDPHTLENHWWTKQFPISVDFDNFVNTSTSALKWFGTK